MARPHPLRASWAATKKRLRQEELRRGAQAQAKWDAASAGHLRGRKERELEYRRVCSTSREVCHVSLCEPPQNDRTYVRLTGEDLERRTPFDPYERPYRCLQVATALFVPVRKVWTDGRVNVQWWDWEFKGVNG